MGSVFVCVVEPDGGEFVLVMSTDNGMSPNMEVGLS